MRRLFLKIFLWFWITAILTGIALVLTWVVQPGSVPGRWRAALSDTARLYAIAAVGELDRGGAPAAARYLDGLHRGAATNACLFDERSRPVAGQRCRMFSSLVARTTGLSNPVVFGMRYGIAQVSVSVRGNDGRRYVFATELPAGPRAVVGPEGYSLLLHWLVAFLVSGLICYFLARYLTTPILRLRSASRQLAAGRLDARVAHGTDRRDELGELVRDFNAMGDRIEALVSSQRQLISDVSHELRSPLARLTVAVDLARERKGDDPVFDRMDKDHHRLDDMLARLLTVARLDSSATPPEMEGVELNDIVQEVVEDAQFESRDRNCTVRFAPGDNLVVRGNRELLHSAIENVIRNAIRYAPPSSEVNVSARAESTVAVVTIRDHGPGVPASELGNIFRPFYRSGDARDRQSGGVGLGLAIAARVARLHDGQIRAANADGGGLQIEISLPLWRD